MRGTRAQKGRDANRFSISRVSRVDEGGVHNAYRDWPSLAQKGFESRFGFAEGAFKRACVLGMGGSAAGGDIIAGWLSLRPGVEFRVFKGSLPLVDMRGTLAIACSASGQTPETIAMAKTAARSGATVVCISSGGRLQEEASSLGLEHVKMPEIIAPRYMLPFIVFSCLTATGRGLGLEYTNDALESIDSMRKQAAKLVADTPLQKNGSKLIASKIVGRTPAIFGDGVTCGVGLRFKNALNENAKMHAYFDSMPDLFHNEVQAWEGMDSSFLPVFLRHSFEDENEGKRADAMERILARLGSRPLEVSGTGRGILSQLMTMVYELDFASYYTAIALGRDPLPTRLIDRLKEPR